jgi:hypothetical protein
MPARQKISQHRHILYLYSPRKGDFPACGKNLHQKAC